MGLQHVSCADFYKHTDTNSFVHVLRKKMRVSRFTWMRYVRGLEFRLSSARGASPRCLSSSLNLPHRHFFRNQPTCALEQLLPGGVVVVGPKCHLCKFLLQHQSLECEQLRLGFFGIVARCALLLLLLRLLRLQLRPRLTKGFRKVILNWKDRG